MGHQAYAHKLLTGRRERFRTIRTAGGLAGFPERHESEHDAFGVGHASTAISAALGMLEARVTGAPGRVVALVGDGALTGGVAFEGLNQAGYLGRDLLVVLNDNEMSISPNVGALSEWFSKKFASRTYNRWRHAVKDFLAHVPKGPEAIEMIRGINATKALVTPGILFEGLGFRYVGPVDGHDVKSLVETFRKLAIFDGPVLLHAITTKGKGYQPAESDKATRGHGLSFFDVATGKPVKKASAKAYTGSVRGRAVRGDGAGSARRRDHRRDARGPASSGEAALPGSDMRRGDRGAARGDVRRGPRVRGHPARRRDLLHVPAARVRQDHPRRRAPSARDVRARPGRARRRRRQDAPGRVRRRLPAVRAEPRRDGPLRRE